MNANKTVFNMEEQEDRVREFFLKAEKKFPTIKIIGEPVDAEEILKTAWNYYNDAQHFREKGDIIGALAALEYAEGFVDAGRKLGLLAAEHTGEIG